MAKGESAEENNSSHWEELGEDSAQILDVRREMATAEGPFEKFSRLVGRVMGSAMFFTLLIVTHIAWIVLNLRIWPWRPIDPYPFTFLATIASVEAPFLSLLILINQRRHRQIEDVREEIELKVSLHSERQMSMMIRLIDEIRRAQGLPTEEDEKDIQRLGRNLDPKQLAESARREEENAKDKD